MATKLKDVYPWTSTPVIINAPMGGFAGDALATVVTQAGGIGLIGAVFDMKALASQLQKAKDTLSKSDLDCSTTLPLGVGLLPFVSKLEEAMPVLKEFQPAIVWLFAAKEFDDYAEWSGRIRSALPNTKVWIQVGSVTAALSVARICRPDVLVLQGSDAGGHGFEHGAGITSLVPEATDVLKANGFDIPLVASGGIVDGRGVASALALGADGVVMGTRFLSAPETVMHPKYREAVLAAQDGGLSTIRAKLFDELRGPNIWPTMYDGRALATDSYIDFKKGMSVDDVRGLHMQAAVDEDAGFGKNPRAAVWAGTGVGMVNQVKPAAEIVAEVRSGARELLESLRSRL